ncbi:hypothetical protein P691DRAFT_810691 [Macrolepiota fuliginosa MF-IS2]|uniref:Uncharacterized protein n=1 Tax=Macrolepiota fuliginosa MF-IS2 TaxID=1400762 RepID=A0A9P6BYD7_9AGAR|nr:hypothetical protein P691DRAFT_810691 [Macrolepiota fuliginosa MF-IS2]
MTTPLSYMCIPSALIDKGKSFEEVRMDDYIQAYMTTSKPPQPVPRLPAGDKERSSLGLPPLFKPVSEYDPILASRPKESSFSSSQLSGSRKKDLADIPATQDFKGEKVGAETFYTISCSEPYTWFSPEELRHHAYQKGHRYPPSDELQSITTKPEFAQHSFEELRVVYMLSGRELTSAEIIAAMQPR